jgi:hypothetical protein
LFQYCKHNGTSDTKMISIIFLPYLKQHLKIAKVLCCLPFEWNDNSASTQYHISVIQSRWRRFIVRAQMLLLGLLLMFEAMMLAISPYSRRKKVQALVFISIYVAGFFLRWNWSFNGTTMELLNSCINFEQGFFKGNCNQS